MHDKRGSFPMVEAKYFFRCRREKGRKAKGFKKMARHDLTNTPRVQPDSSVFGTALPGERPETQATERHFGK